MPHVLAWPLQTLLPYTQVAACCSQHLPKGCACCHNTAFLHPTTPPAHPLPAAGAFSVNTVSSGSPSASAATSTTAVLLAAYTATWSPVS